MIPVDPENPEPREQEEGEPRPGLPDEATVVSETILTSPKGRRYRILRTTQRDAYDDQPAENDADDEVRERDEP